MQDVAGLEGCPPHLVIPCWGWQGKAPTGPSEVLAQKCPRESHGGTSAAPDFLPTHAPHPRESGLGSGEGGVLQSLLSSKSVSKSLACGGGETGEEGTAEETGDHFSQDS